MPGKEELTVMALLVLLKSLKQPECLTVEDLLNGDVTVQWGTVQLFKAVMICVFSYSLLTDVCSSSVSECHF